MRPQTSSTFDTTTPPSGLSDPVVLRRNVLHDPTKRLSLNFNPSIMSPEKRNEMIENSMDTQLVQLERDTLELRRELQDAIANKKASESKILA